MSSLETILSCPTLPSLPAIAMELLKLTRDPGVSVAKIAVVVQNDPALSAKVLKTVNSSFYGLTQKCSKIDRALGFLGLNTVKSVVLGFSLVDSARSVQSGNGFDIDQHWKRSIYSSAAARAIAAMTGHADQDEAFTATLFSDIGVLAAVVALGAEYGEIVGAAGTQHTRLSAMERERLGTSHEEIGAEIAKKWNLSPLYESAIRFHHDADSAPAQTQRLVRVVALATLMSECLVAESPQAAMTELRVKSSRWVSDEFAASIESIMNKVADSAQEVARMFDKKIGVRPDVRTILGQASDQILEAQLESAQRQEELQRATVTDALTGASNRKHFDAMLPAMWEQCRSQGRPMAVLFVDADRFKSINDTLGHQAGDAVLVELARRARETIGQSGSVFRYGGEEFAVLLAEQTLAQAKNVAERLRKAVEAPAFDLTKVAGAAPERTVTISIGVAAHEPGGVEAVRHESPAALVKAADEGVYEAKRLGRNRVATAGPTAAPSGAAIPTGTVDSGKTGGKAVAATIGPGPAASPNTSATPGRTLVLLVDDDPLSMKLLKAALMRSPGVEVVCAGSVDDASRMLAGFDSSTRPDLVLADFQLGRRTGLEVINFVRHAPALGETSTVIISSDDDDETRRASLAAGANGFISKIDIARDLVRGVSTILAHIKKAA